MFKRRMGDLSSVLWRKRVAQGAAAISLLALVTACGTAPMMSGSGQMTPPDGKAYAIVALTFDSWDKDTANVSFVLQGPDGTHEYFAQAMTDFIRDAGDIPDAIGKLHLLTLTPGHYVLPSVWARWHDGSDTIIFSNHVVNIPLNQQFDVRAGQVVYLGDIHAKLNYQPSVAIVDSTARDMNHIKVIWKVPDTSNIQRLPLQPLQVPATAAH